jgi:hypothetical protein
VAQAQVHTQSTTPLEQLHLHRGCVYVCVPFNARNIKGENTGQNTKMNYTPPITALSEMTEKIVRIRKYHHQQPPQTPDLVAMATCYCSWAINIFSLHEFTGSKSTLKRRIYFSLIAVER